MDMREWRVDRDATVHFRGASRSNRGNGRENSAAVVIELERGNALGEHTGSPEEILLVMQGTVGVEIGDERKVATPGTVAVVPAMVPHNMRNVGDDTARIIGYFPRPRAVSTCAEPLQPPAVQVLVHGDTEAKTAADWRRPSENQDTIMAAVYEPKYSFAPPTRPPKRNLRPRSTPSG